MHKKFKTQLFDFEIKFNYVHNKFFFYFFILKKPELYRHYYRTIRQH